MFRLVIIMLTGLYLYANDVGEREFTVQECGLMIDSNNKFYRAFRKHDTFYIKTGKIDEWFRIDKIKNIKFRDFFPVDCKEFEERI